jgi:hypothetical protein
LQIEENNLPVVLETVADAMISQLFRYKGGVSGK